MLELITVSTRPPGREYSTTWWEPAKSSLTKSPKKRRKPQDLACTQTSSLIQSRWRRLDPPRAVELASEPARNRMTSSNTMGRRDTSSEDMAQVPVFTAQREASSRRSSRFLWVIVGCCRWTTSSRGPNYAFITIPICILDPANTTLQLKLWTPHQHWKRVMASRNRQVPD